MNVRMSITLPEEMRKKLNKIAKTEMRTPSNTIAYLIKQYKLKTDGRSKDDFATDVITTGLSNTQQSRMRSIIDIIQKLCDASEDGNARREDIISEAEIDGIERSVVEDAIDRLKHNGQIYEPIHGGYRLSNM